MQNSIQFPLTSPPAYPGSALTSGLNAAFQTIITLQQGTTAPTSGALGLSGLAGIFWHDLSTGNLNVRNQADTTWITLGTFNETLGTFAPINSFVSLGNWASGTAYAIGNVVGVAGSSYVCTSGNTNEQPPNPTFWNLLAASGASGAPGASGASGASGAPGAPGLQLSAPSVTALRALPSTAYSSGQSAYLASYFAPSGAALPDSGGGTLTWNASSTATDDGFSVFQPSGAVSGRLLRASLPRINAVEAGLIFESAAQATQDNLAQLIKLISWVALVSGAVIQCPAGVLGLSDLPSNWQNTNAMFFEGVGKSSTIIQRLAGSASTNPVMWYGSQASSLNKVVAGGLKNLTVDGNGIAPYALRITSMDFGRWENVAFVNAAATSANGGFGCMMDVVSSTPAWPHAQGTPGNDCHFFSQIVCTQNGAGFSGVQQTNVRNAGGLAVDGNSLSDTFKCTFVNIQPNIYFGDGIYIGNSDTNSFSDITCFEPAAESLVIVGASSGNTITTASSLTGAVSGMQVRGPGVFTGINGRTNTTITSISGEVITLSTAVNGPGLTNATFVIGGGTILIADGTSGFPGRHNVIHNVQSGGAPILSIDSNYYTQFTGTVSSGNLLQIGNISNTSGLASGMYIYGFGLVPVNTIASIIDANTISLTKSAGFASNGMLFSAAFGSPAGPTLITSLNLGNQTAANLPYIFGNSQLRYISESSNYGGGWETPIFTSAANAGIVTSQAYIAAIPYWGLGGPAVIKMAFDNNISDYWVTDSAYSATFRVNTSTGNAEFSIPSGTLIINGAPASTTGIIDALLTPAATASGTPSTELQTVALPRGTLATASELDVFCQGTYAADTNFKGVQFHFGSLIVNGPTVATSGGAGWTFNFKAWRAAPQTFTGTFTSGANTIQITSAPLPTATQLVSGMGLYDSTNITYLTGITVSGYNAGTGVITTNATLANTASGDSLNAYGQNYYWAYSDAATPQVSQVGFTGQLDGVANISLQLWGVNGPQATFTGTLVLNSPTIAVTGTFPANIASGQILFDNTNGSRIPVTPTYTTVSGWTSPNITMSANANSGGASNSISTFSASSEVTCNFMTVKYTSPG